MTRLVLDTNVWVSSVVVPGSVCERLVQRLARLDLQLATSAALLTELERVLKGKFGYTTEEVRRGMTFVRSLCTVVEPTQQVTAVSAHEADNRVLECAIEAQADLIVTGDKQHLLPLKHYRGIPIESPGAVLARLE